MSVQDMQQQIILSRHTARPGCLFRAFASDINGDKGSHQKLLGNAFPGLLKSKITSPSKSPKTMAITEAPMDRIPLKPVFLFTVSTTLRS